MPIAPQINLPDNTGSTQNLVLTTNQDAIILEGVADPNTVDIQVSRDGGPFISDPSLIKFDLPSFTFPNTDSYPNGLPLNSGLNLILIRTIDIVGGVSAPATANITRVTSEANPFKIPTGIQVRRLRDAVKILAANPLQNAPAAIQAANPENFIGLNFYASPYPSGGSTGYVRVNESVVTEVSSILDENVSDIASELTTWSNTNQQIVRLQVTEEDRFGKNLSTRLDQRYDVSSLTDKLRFSSTFQNVIQTEYITFTHKRSGGAGIINSDQFTNVDSTDPLYYVCTALYFDPTTNTEIESSYSQEVVGTPLIIDTNIRDLPPRNQKSIQVDFMNAIQRVNAEISLIPGSTTRDVSIDPFSSEAERIWFILDFIHRSASFLTLLQIDDANGDGVSDPVSSSSYKQALKAALGFTQDTAVQSLIDQQFDKLAANLNTKRLPGRPSVGQVVFYTARKPTFDVPIPAGTFVSTTADSSLGIPSVRYRVGGTYVLSAANAEAYFNFDRKRYEVTVDVVADTIGADGNRPAGQIKNSQGVSLLSVINLESTVFGSDRESNADLATRAQLALPSVDTGTEGGYTRTATAQTGIVRSKVIKSGDSLMMRDYDPVRKKHIGGKVDVWVQGLRERQVSERFAFTFAQAFNVPCDIVGNVSDLTFRVRDPRVTVNTPLIQVLDNPSKNIGVHNITTGALYNLQNIQYLDYQTFKLDTSISANQPNTASENLITADFRFRLANKFTFTFQPVRRVVSVTGESSGSLDSVNGYKLFKLDDPLLNGESSIASNYLEINQFGGVPTGESISVNNELHVLIGFVQEPLLSIGINIGTIKVFSQDRLITYAGPSASNPDYLVIEGTPTTPAKIVRTANSTIETGATVSIDYDHDENFTVVYVINDLIQELQRTLEINRHATADVLVKQAVDNPLNIESTVQLSRGATKDKADPAIRSAVSQELDSKLIGEGTAQGDIISKIDSSFGVDYPIVPLARMSYADGSQKLRESVLSFYTALPSLDIGGNSVYILNNALGFPTTDGGGLETEHRGVFQDDEAMTLSDSLSLVGSVTNQAFIIGSGGAVINGYTDSSTLTSEGFTTDDSQYSEMLRRTANRVVLSLAGGATPDIPTKHIYAVSYVVRGDKGAKDFSSSGVEFLSLGSLTITFREAQVS